MLFLESPLSFDESAGFTAPPAFGTYRVLHQIGSGVLGPVFRTYDPQRDRLVAVKAFRLDLVPEQVARLADALRRLTLHVPAHPGIVAALDAGLEGTTAYLASEYVAAETLDVALRHLAPAPLDRAVPILTSLAEAIDAAWEAGLGHGALHPRDVFVSVDSHQVRVTGFGVAAALESVGAKAPARRPYAAPERVSGEPWDIRADIYALGAVAHELLTRRRPAGSGEQDGALTTDTGPEQRVQIRRVLSTVLAERPQHRFASARAFTDALAAIARGEAMAPLPEPEGEPESPAQPSLFVVSSRDDMKWSEPEPASETAPPAIEPPPADAAPAVGPTVAVEPPTPAVSVTPSETFFPSPGPEPAVSAQMPHVPAPLPPAAPSLPWSALAAVGVALLVVGIAIGYYFGRASTAPPPASPAATTEVAVPAEPAPVTEPPTPAPAPREEERATSAAQVPGQRASGTPPTRPTGAGGRLIVRSVPPGALVVVDGRPRGQTPASLFDLAFGTHTLEVARSGFVPHTEKVTLSPKMPARTLSVQLEPGVAAAGEAPRAGAASGSIFIDSRPQDARVIIDGRFAGMTPLRVPGVRIGPHDVRLERAGYQPFSATVGVKAGEQARVTAALEERRRD